MEIKKYLKEERDENLIEILTKVWRSSVEKTHTFLKEKDIENISKYVPLALKEIKELVVVEINDRKIGFLGIDGRNIEMLFLEPESIGKGIGKNLIEYAKLNYQTNKVSVNEDNPNAIKFYNKMGFEVYRRRETDDMGNPFPILDMILK